MKAQDGYLSSATHPTPWIAEEMQGAPMQKPVLFAFNLESADYLFRLWRTAVHAFLDSWCLLAKYLGHAEALPFELS